MRKMCIREIVLHYAKKFAKGIKTNCIADLSFLTHQKPK